MAPPKYITFVSPGDLVLMYLTKFDAKMTKIKQNYMANMIMNVLGTV